MTVQLKKTLPAKATPITVVDRAAFQALATGLPVTATGHMTDTYARAPRPADAAARSASASGSPMACRSTWTA